MPKKVIIMGAAGRDFHNFNCVYRNNRSYEVVAFTATQIPDIAGRKYPAVLAGKLYPKGIPIKPEEDLDKLIVKQDVDVVAFSYSDVRHEYLMHQASRVQKLGADFILLGPKQTMLKSKKPVVAVCAVRTGCGKSQTTRRVCEILRGQGLQVAVIRHPMPYGNLAKQACQRFGKLADLDVHKCTIEEREEYEPHIIAGNIVYAGVDYGMILAQAEKEADVIVWDGGNNDTSFYRADLYITVADPHRPGHELTYYPGETNLRLADIVVLNKIATAPPEGVQEVRRNIAAYNPAATVIEADSPITVEDPSIIRGKRVLVIEDGPTLTHGEMLYGAGIVAAKNNGAAEIVDPKPYAKGTIAETFEKYAHVKGLLPAMGYGAQQVADLEATINAVPCDAVVIGTPIDLRRICRINKPSVRVTYELQEIGKPDLADALAGFGKKRKK